MNAVMNTNVIHKSMSDAMTIHLDTIHRQAMQYSYPCYVDVPDGIDVTRPKARQSNHHAQTST